MRGATATPTSSSRRSSRPRRGVIADDSGRRAEAQDERSWRRIALIAVAVLALPSAIARRRVGCLLTPDAEGRSRTCVGGPNAERDGQAAGRRASRSRSIADPVRRRGRGPRRRAGPGRRREARRGVRGHDHGVERARARRRSRPCRAWARDAATDRLREAGLPRRAGAPYSDTVGEGRVIETRRREGHELAQGHDRDDRRLARPRAGRPCPTWSGSRSADAEAALQQAGARRVRRPSRRTRTPTRARCSSQDPGGRRGGRPGSTVRSSSPTRRPTSQVPGVIDAERGRRPRHARERRLRGPRRRTPTSTRPTRTASSSSQDPGRRTSPRSRARA